MLILVGPNPTLMSARIVMLFESGGPENDVAYATGSFKEIVRVFCFANRVGHSFWQTLLRFAVLRDWHGSTPPTV